MKLYDLDFVAIGVALGRAGERLRTLKIDWFGPDVLGPMPKSKPPRFGATKVRTLQKVKRPAAFLSQDWLEAAEMLGDLEVGVYIPRGWREETGVREADIDKQIVDAFKASGFENAWTHPDLQGVIQVFVSTFARKQKTRRAGRVAAARPKAKRRK